MNTEQVLGVARSIDASIYRDTFPAIRIAILSFIIAIFFFLFIISTCSFCQVIPEIHNYVVEIFCDEISVC